MRYLPKTCNSNSASWNLWQGTSSNHLKTKNWPFSANRTRFWPIFFLLISSSFWASSFNFCSCSKLFLKMVPIKPAKISSDWLKRANFLSLSDLTMCLAKGSSWLNLSCMFSGGIAYLLTMRKFKVRVYPSKEKLPKEKQLAWALAELASHNIRADVEAAEMVAN